LTKNSKVLVVGYGSIGQRHARLLTKVGCHVAVASQKPVDFSPHFSDLTHALEKWQPEYVIVANRTSEHDQAIEILSGQDFSGRVLIEKPLFDRVKEFPRHRFSMTAVAYNLRCHPLLMRLKSILDGTSHIATANIYVGSYLPDWRPNTDYSESYSAKKSEGGGVLRDLSHELDYTLWLFGEWMRLTALGGHFSGLEIDSDDAYTLILETKKCPLVSLHMNYLDRIPRREISVNTDRGSLHVDLIGNTLTINGTQESIEMHPDHTYLAEHQNMFAGRIEGLCSLEEGMEILRMVEAAERASQSHTWISR
jgi:predicted dehydrogenase